MNQSSQYEPEAIWNSVAEVEQSTQKHIAASRLICERLLAAAGERTADNTLELYNDLLVEIDRITGLAELIGNVHPAADVREAANQAFQKLAQYLNELKLNRSLYDALNQVQTDGLDPDSRCFMEHTLRDYRRAGVDKAEPVRRQLADLHDQMVAAGQEFSRNIREGERFIEIGQNETDGLPADFLASHPADSHGRIKITTAYADYEIFMKYSSREDLRESLYRQFQTRAYPQNEAVLTKLLTLRHQYAVWLGYPSWAEYSAEDKMVKKASVISDFIDRVAEMARPRMLKDRELLLARKRLDQPGAERVNDWDTRYYTRQVREEQFDIDEQAIRAFFGYPQVKDGLLKLTAELFSIELVRSLEQAVWAPEVEVYDVFDQGVLIGQVYLDLFPRRDKYSHVATFPGQTGIQGRQIGQVALVGNFPGPGSAEPAFWEHNDVVTFLHEFGHTIHSLLSYKHHWVTVAGLNCQWDFVEVPSQLYEEWAWDAAVLSRFAIDYQSGLPIPADLVSRLKQSSEFGKGLGVNRQMAYARYSLYCHDHDPSDIDLLGSCRRIVDQYSPFSYVEGTNTYTSFGHLEGYSSMYYCYMWSLSLVKDILTRFQSQDLMDKTTALAYRRSILETGGAKDGDIMLRDFLGRETSFEAFQKWLEE